MGDVSVNHGLLDGCDTPQTPVCSQGNRRERPDPLVMVAFTLATRHKAQRAFGWPSHCLGILAWGIIRWDFVPPHPPPPPTLSAQSVSGSCDRQWHTGPHSEKAQFTTEGREGFFSPREDDKLTAAVGSCCCERNLSAYLSVCICVHVYGYKSVGGVSMCVCSCVPVVVPVPSCVFQHIYYRVEASVPSCGWAFTCVYVHPNSYYCLKLPTCLCTMWCCSNRVI